MSSGIFPTDFKESIFIPLSKKESLDFNIFSYYRPVSNLSFLSKVLERIAYYIKKTDTHDKNEESGDEVFIFEIL